MQLLYQLLLICDYSDLLLVLVGEASVPLLLGSVVEVANRALIDQVHRLLLLSDLDRLQIDRGQLASDIIDLDVLVYLISDRRHLLDGL